MNVTTGPGKYVRLPGLVGEAGLYIRKFGKTAVLIGGKTSLEIVKGPLNNSLTEHGITLVETLWYGGESSAAQIDRLVEQLQSMNFDVLIAAGGGKATDTVKAVAHRVNKPLVAIPTIAATCAAATPISIIYSDGGEFLEISRGSKAPELVLADTAIILQAPVRYLIAGIGDTLAKWFETKCSVQKAVPTVLNRTAIAIAGQLYGTLREKGKTAVTSIEAQALTGELEEIIDGIILVSGSVSGYGGDDCRTAGAHAIYSGLTIFPEVHESFHGEIVAFGILAQLCMEGADEEEIKELIGYYREVGLPFTLSQMGINDLTEEQWKQLGEVSVTIEDMANMPFEVTPGMVIAAVEKADRIGKESLQHI